jgi:hypothetical protein
MPILVLHISFLLEQREILWYGVRYDIEFFSFVLNYRDHDRDQWWALVNMVVNLSSSIKGNEFLD